MTCTKDYKNLIFSGMLVLFAMAVFSGCAAMTGRTAGEYVDDVSITTAANAAIVKDTDAHYLKVDVTSTQGDVILQGFVNSRETEQRLIDRIRQIRGVKSVTSNLKIEEKK